MRISAEGVLFTFRIQKDNLEMLKRCKLKRENRLLLSSGHTLFGLVFLLAGKMNPTASIMPIKLTDFNIDISISPTAVLFGIIMIILYIGYRWIRARFISVWISAKIFSFSISHEMEVETRSIGAIPVLTLQPFYQNLNSCYMIASKINSHRINVGRLG